MNMQGKNTPFIAVTVLGSGTCVPSPSRSSCSMLMEIDDQKLLFDSGPGTMRRLAEAGVTIDKITHIFYSHLHPDHTGELAPFLFATKYAGFAPRQQPVTIVAGKGFQQFFNRLTNVYGDWIQLNPDDFQIREMDTAAMDQIRFSRFTVQSIPVTHNPESIAFKITDSNQSSVVYSGDTDYSTNLIQLATDSDLLICESATPDQQKIPGHLTPSLAGKIATESRTRKLLLTHFYPECEKVDIAKECRKTYSGDLLLAKDLMRIELR